MADKREQAWADYHWLQRYSADRGSFNAGYDAQQAEIDRLRALLEEARTALHHVESGPDEWHDCCREIVGPVLAKLAQEAGRG